MKITLKDVEYSAKLARLELSGQEREKFASQLEAILEYIGQLNRLDTEGVPPTSHVLDLKNVWRPDEARPCGPERTAMLLGNAPDREEGFFKVKKIIE